MPLKTIKISNYKIDMDEEGYANVILIHCPSGRQIATTIGHIVGLLDTECLDIKYKEMEPNKLPCDKCKHNKPSAWIKGGFCDLTGIAVEKIKENTKIEYCYDYEEKNDLS